MSKRSNELLHGVWSRHEVPGTGISAEFPLKPVSESERQGQEIVTKTLYLEQHAAEGAFRLDLAVSTGRPRETPSAEALAEQLRKQLSRDPAFEVLAVDPKPFGSAPGAVQRMRLRETGEILRQWIIFEPDRTVFAGITTFNDGFDELGTRFLNSVSLSVSS